MAEKIVAASLVVNTGDSAAKVNEVNQSLSETKKTANTAGDALNKVGNDSKGATSSFGNLRKSLTDVSPAAESASKASGILNNALNILRANPIIAVLTGLVAIVIGLFQPFKKMEAVSDSLGKAFGILGGVFSGFINKVLTPLIDGFTFLVDLFTNSVVNVLDALGITSKETANRLGEITDALDDLEDSEKNAAIATAEANRKLQEAREIAGDANVPIKERIEALKLAGKIEKEELDKVVEVNRMKTALVLEQIAMELGAKSDLIAKIREGSLENLKAARLELANMKNVDKEKLYAIDQQIIAAENAAAQSAKIGKKTQSQIDSLNKEQAAKEKEAADKRKAEREKEVAEYNKYLQVKNKLTNEANLAAITDDIKIAKQKILNNEKDRIKEVDALKVSLKEKAELIKMINRSTQQELNKIDAEKLAKDKESAQKEYDEWKKAYTERIAKEEAEKKKIDNDRIDAIIKKSVDEKKIRDEIELRTLSPQEKYEEELFALQRKYDEELKIVGTNEELKARLEREYAEASTQIKSNHLNQQLDETQSVGDKITQVIGQQTAVGKGLGVANALINTYQGATDALRAKSTLPSPFDVVAKIANVAAVLASGFKAVKAITSVQVPGAGGGGSTPSVPAPISPTQTSTKLDAASIQGVGNAASAGAGRSFVLDTDIKNNAERDARLNRAARLA